jgi:raffinose/stachyose/melibiose transport system substrate-binding protein
MNAKIIAIVVVIGVVIAAAVLLGGGEEKPIISWWTVHAGSPIHIPWHGRVTDRYNDLYGENLRLERSDYSNPDFKAAFRNVMAAAAPPDLWHSWGGGILKKYVDAGRVADLTDLLNENWAVELLPLENRDKLLWNSTWNNRHYGFPYTIGDVQFFINTEIFDECGVDVPDVSAGETWTWDEFTSAIENFKGKKNSEGKDIYPIVVAGAEEWQLSFYYMYLVDRIGGPDYFEKTLNREPGYSFTDSVFVEAGEKCVELKNLGAFQTSFIVDGYDMPDYYFTHGRAAMYLQGSWAVSTFRYRASDLQFDVIRFPTVPGGAGDPTDLIATIQDYVCVSESSEYKEEAFQLIRLLGSEWCTNDFLENVGDILIFDSRLGGGLEVPAEKYDPVILKEVNEVANSNHLQMVWDQYAPEAFAIKHIQLMRDLFQGLKTPEQVAQEHEDRAQQLVGEGELPITW